MNLFQQTNPLLIPENNLYEPYISKLIQPSWTKTFLAIFFTLGITSGSFYFYYRYIKPLISLVDQSKEWETQNVAQTQKISNLDTEIKDLKNIVKNLSDNIEKLTKEKVELMQNVQREMNLVHSQLLKDGNNDIKVELAEIRGMLKNNNSISRVEYVDRDRDYEGRYEKGFGRERGKELEKKESFDDLFERGMSFRKTNPYLEEEENSKTKESPIESPKDIVKEETFENTMTLESNSSLKDLNELRKIEEDIEKKIEQEEEENVLENFKVIQETAEPKLKNSNLFQFINTLNNQNTQDKQRETFNDIYSPDTNQTTPFKEEIKQEDTFKKFEEYNFENDAKYQESFGFTKEKLQNLEGEELEKAILRFKEKYYQRYVDQTFDIDAYLEYRDKSVQTPYSQSYMDIISKLQNNETIDVQKIDDKPKPNAKSSTPKAQKKTKPWEKKKTKSEMKKEESENTETPTNQGEKVLFQETDQ